MAVSVTMPRLGESVTEGTVTRWLKKEGERVEMDEPLLEVSTDKVDTEIPSPAAGIVTLDQGPGGRDRRGRRRAGDHLRRRRPAAAAAGREASACRCCPEPAAAEPGAGDRSRAGRSRARRHPPPHRPAPGPGCRCPAARAAPAPPPPAPAARRRLLLLLRPLRSGGRRRGRLRHAAGPQARDRARRRPLHPAGHRRRWPDPQAGRARRRRSGPGQPGCRLRPAARHRPLAPAPLLPPPRRPLPPARRGARCRSRLLPRLPPLLRPRPAVGRRPARGRTEPLSRLRKVIATRMVESLQVSAQLTTVLEADVTAIAKLRSPGQGRLRGPRGRQAELPAVLRARRHRGAQGAPDGQRQHRHGRPARSPTTRTSTSASRSTPSAACSCRSSRAPATSTCRASPARSPTSPSAPAATRCGPDELGGGTFTVTNTGSRGALFDTPIINQPQVGILGTGAVVKRPVVVSDRDLGEVVAVRSMVYLALTYDHRIVDGADAARFLSTMKDRLEEGDFAGELGV